MPRVSDAHLAARRDQIMEAATRCFARNGFHATSMQDVIAEAGLSVGAVYRYFRSKEELRWAIAEKNVSEIAVALDDVIGHEPPLTLAQVLERALDIVESRLGRYGAANIAVQVWAESLRDEEMRKFVAAAFARLRAGFITLSERARDAGHLPPDIDPETLGASLFCLLPGYVLQRQLTGLPTQDTMRAGVHALLSLSVPVPAVTPQPAPPHSAGHPHPADQGEEHTE